MPKSQINRTGHHIRSGVEDLESEIAVEGWRWFFSDNGELIVVLMGGVAIIVALLTAISEKTISAEIQRVSNEQIAAANERAASAELTAAEANLSAAVANKTAEGERLARLKIEARLAPRALKSPQQSELAERLKGLPPQKGTIIAAPGLPESKMLANGLLSPLRAAGWDITELPSTTDSIFTFPTGVIIRWQLDPKKPANLFEQEDMSRAAVALADSLNEYGISATAIPALPPLPSVHTIAIIISTK